MNKLDMSKVSDRFVKIADSMCEGTTASIYCRGKTSAPLRTKIGVRQECVMSPLFFALFLNDLHKSLTGLVNVSK